MYHLTISPKKLSRGIIGNLMDQSSKADNIVFLIYTACNIARWLSRTVCTRTTFCGGNI